MTASAVITRGPSDPHRIDVASSGPAAAAAILRGMRETLRGVDGDRLERSCDSRRDRIRLGASAPGLERAEVFLSTVAFEPHRHDTYAIGITTAGVQTFRYRGSRRISLPGQVHVLHPDELHDGAAGTDDGFGYRILYLAPAVLGAALDGAPLPFLPDPVPRAGEATRRLASLLRDVAEPVGELRLVEIATTVADALRVLAGARTPTVPVDVVDVAAVDAVRAYLAEHAREQ